MQFVEVEGRRTKHHLRVSHLHAVCSNKYYGHHTRIHNSNTDTHALYIHITHVHTIQTHFDSEVRVMICNMHFGQWPNLYLSIEIVKISPAMLLFSLLFSFPLPFDEQTNNTETNKEKGKEKEEEEVSATLYT